MNKEKIKEARKIVNGKLLDKTVTGSHVEIYKELFGVELNSSEARKRLYGLRDLFKAVEDDVVERNRIRCLIMNDIHLPFERDDVLDVIRENKDVDYIIFGGDLIDCVSCSSFDTMDRPSVEEELVYAHEFICKVNKIIDPDKTKIIAITGNHEARYKREIVRLQAKQMQTLLNPNLLSMLEDGFTVYPKGKKKTYDPIGNFEYIDNWYAKLFGNIIITHPMNFSNVGGKVSEQVAEYMLNQDVLEKGDLIFLAHTHKFSMLKNNRRQGVCVVENACMCKNHEYANAPKLSFTPQNYGYSIVEFDEGEKVDINDVKFVHLD